LAKNPPKNNIRYRNDCVDLRQFLPNALKYGRNIAGLSLMKVIFFGFVISLSIVEWRHLLWRKWCKSDENWEFLTLICDMRPNYWTKTRSIPLINGIRQYV